jgi:hypothetical protein
MDNTTRYITIAVIAAIVLFSIYLVTRRDRDHFGIQLLPTSPEVEYIQGHPDYNIVADDGISIIPHGDIAQSERYGVGEGLIGFGRFGSSFMA